MLQRGFQLQYRNYRRPATELDLVFQKGHQLLVIEVKTRKLCVDDYRQLVPPRKLQALWRGMDILLAEHPEWQNFTLHLGLAVVSGLTQSRKTLRWMRLPSRKDL